MSLVQLEYFVAIAEEGHLTRAAQRLHISQPPLSRQLRSLEEELGAPLFARTPKGMNLLPAGQRFLPRARQILALVARAGEDVAGASDEQPASGGSGLEPPVVGRNLPAHN